jgi:hypothetical protein
MKSSGSAGESRLRGLKISLVGLPFGSAVRFEHGGPQRQIHDWISVSGLDISRQMVYNETGLIKPI